MPAATAEICRGAGGLLGLLRRGCCPRAVALFSRNAMRSTRLPLGPRLPQQLLRGGERVMDGRVAGEVLLAFNARAWRLSSWSLEARRLRPHRRRRPKGPVHDKLDMLSCP